MPKVTATIRLRAYVVVRRAVEEGVAYGWRRAHKYDENPTDETATDALVLAVMGELCEVLDLDLDLPEDDS